MNHRKGRSLKKQLTKRLILLQVLTLIVFVLVAAVPISRYITGPLLDDRVVEDIVNSITQGPSGLQLELNKNLQHLKADNPGFWFVAVNEAGETASLGSFPEPLLPMLPHLRYVTTANISDTGNIDVPVAIVRHMAGPSGMLYVISGGGPTFEPLSFRQLLANKFFVGLVTLMTVVMVVAIPFMIERELCGLRGAAREAEEIDVDKRGVRLSAGDIPVEMHPLVQAINQALSRLDDGFARRQRFLADAAHELRTPIAILATRIQLMDETNLKQSLMLDVARLSNLADQLLDLHRLDGESMIRETIDLVDLAAQVTGDLAPLAIAAGDDIAFDADADRVMVEGDHVALCRALTNLIQNAISHAGDKAEIDVFVGKAGILRVSDNGPGIPDSERIRIFEPFYRIVPGQRGAGLGLNLVSDIVARHNGSITVSDSPSGGATFTIQLPLATCAEAAVSTPQKDMADA